jgi:CarD family transcriptional regulator
MELEWKGDFNLLKGGDSVFYPYHGTGTIESKEYITVKEQEKEFFKVFFPNRKMHILVPNQDKNWNGLRPIISLDQFETVKKDFYDECVPLPSSVSERSKFLEKKMKSGTTSDLFHIMRDLLNFHITQGKLSPLDKKTYHDAEAFLTEEIELMKNISFSEASSEMKSEIGNRFNIAAPTFK